MLDTEQSHGVGFGVFEAYIIHLDQQVTILEDLINLMDVSSDHPAEQTEALRRLRDSMTVVRAAANWAKGKHSRKDAIFEDAVAVRSAFRDWLEACGMTSTDWEQATIEATDSYQPFLVQAPRIEREPTWDDE